MEVVRHPCGRQRAQQQSLPWLDSRPQVWTLGTLSHGHLVLQKMQNTPAPVRCGGVLGCNSPACDNLTTPESEQPHVSVPVPARCWVRQEPCRMLGGR